MTESHGLSADDAFLDALRAEIAGDLAAAEGHLRRALEMAPEHVGALHQLATLTLRLGRPAEAEAAAERALALLPEDAPLWLTLGSAWRALGRPEAAIGAARRALALQSPFPHAEHLLGSALLDLGQAEAAAAHFRQALESGLDHAEAQSSLGAGLAALHRAEDAVRHCETALPPASAPAWRDLGAVLLALGREAEALDRFRRAAALAPDDAESRYGMGVALTRLGRLDEAVAALDEAVALAPREPKYYRARGWLGLNDAAVAALQALPPDVLDHAARIERHFALAAAHDSRGEAAEAMAHWRVGNRLKRAQSAYDEAATLAHLAEIEAVFGPERLAAGGSGEAPPDLPFDGLLFIVGMPRSGSTLVEQILASHPAVFGAGEAPDLAAAVASVAERHGMGYPEVVPALTARDLRAIGEAYRSRIRTRAPEGRLVADKMLGNADFAGLIALALPGARILHVRRDALDTCLSCWGALFERGQAWSYDLGELGRYRAAHDRLMAHWRRVLPPAVMLDAEYEALVADPEGETRRILSWLGLAWDPACLRFFETERVVRSYSLVQVRRPIHRDAVGRAERYRDWLGPLIEGLAAGSH
jgi:tetratricopeptide (TPR) repeat protein